MASTPGTPTTDAAQSPLVIGVDIGGTQIRAAVLQGATLHSRANAITAGQTAPDVMLPRVFALIDQALQEAQVTLDQVASIGISTPGPVNNRTGIVYEPPNLPGWIQLPLRDIFLQRYSLPIRVENDANTAALGEYLFGAGRGCQHMIYMTVSTGIGGGVIIDGKIVEGSIGTAGEIGHMSIDWHGPVCNCGNRGCLEYFASGPAIARRANEAIKAGQGAELLAFASAMLDHPANVPDRSALPVPQDLNTQPLEQAGQPGEALHVNARTVARAAEAGIPLARSIIAEVAEALGVGLVNLLHLFNPDMIILGGGVALRLGDMLMEPALRIVQERAMAAPRQSVQITLAQLGDNAGLIGAGALTQYYEQLHDHQ
ncbi:MAG TPA: ROK family protein [Ktedonobacteraceae bacterium]|nr:ROK family protein [Ktedonobacteraceae bacterium]